MLDTFLLRRRHTRVYADASFPRHIVAVLQRFSASFRALVFSGMDRVRCSTCCEISSIQALHCTAAPRALRVGSGVGGKAFEALSRIGINSAADVRVSALSALSAAIGEAAARRLAAQASGGGVREGWQRER
eukprot:6196326-Pleurochrysis_carterae.AAC.3